MKERLTIKAFYPHPPDEVWKALTTRKALKQWLLPTDFEPVEGRSFNFGTQISGSVLKVEEARFLSYSWKEERRDDDDAAGSASRVTWTLKPRDGGTELCLEHVPDGFEESYVLIQTQANWRHAVGRSLPALLEAMHHRQPTPIVYSRDKAEDNGRALARVGFRQEPNGNE